MNDDVPEVNGLTPPMLPGSLLPSENESLGTRLVRGGGGGGGGIVVANVRSEGRSYPEHFNTVCPV